MENASGWRTAVYSVDNGLSFQIKGEVEPEHFNLLREKAKELSKKIMENEEYIVITGMTNEALFKLRDQCQRELINRGER